MAIRLEETIRSPSLVSAIIVTYHPDDNALKNLCGTLSNQVNEIIIVDNGSDQFMLEKIIDVHKKIKLISLSCNEGIAYGLNKGIREVSERSEFVILFDQDSEPEENVVRTLIDIFYEANISGVNVCAVGPQFYDSRSGEKCSFYRQEAGGEVKDFCEQSDWVLADHLITSGSLIPVSSFSSVGFMKSELFIDLVDVEWGLRAKSMGMTCVGTARATMKHSIGEDVIQLFGFHIYKHAPIRYYYQIRNRLWLCFRAYVPLMWKLKYGIRIPVLACLYVYNSPHKLTVLKNVLLAVYHAFIGRLGKL